MTPDIKSIVEIIRACDAVHLATFGTNGYPDVRHITNAMNRDITDLSELYFLTGASTQKYAQLHANNHCALYYFDANTRHAARLIGDMELISDVATIEKHWRDEFTRFGYGTAAAGEFVLMRFRPKLYKFYVGPEMHSGNI